MKRYLKYNLNQIDAKLIASKIIKLPLKLQERIGNYTSLIKKQQRLDGLQLLQKAISDSKLDTNIYNLNELQYSEEGKPFFDDEIAFSLAYTDDCSILLFSERGNIGVDIEKRNPIEVSNYRNYFTKNEWDIIVTSSDIELQFYKLWTRKEALVKAIGKGIFLELDEFEVLNDEIILEKKWSLQTDIINENYIVSSAYEIN